MRRITILALATAMALLSVSEVAWGQIVRRYSDGSLGVRAPFVRVYVGPDGETSVRAPFTNIESPGRRYFRDGRPLRGTRGRPTPADPASLDWQTVRRMLRSGVARLDRQLDRLATGQGWKDYLQTSMLGELIADDVNGPPDADSVEVLREALTLYDTTSEKEQFRAIASLRGFQTVHIALSELVVPPVHRQRRMLAHSSKALEHELMRLETGPQWVRYFQLPNEVFAERTARPRSAPLPPSGDSTSEQSLRRLFDAMASFDAVRDDPKYGPIVNLPAFKMTYDRLTTYVAMVSETFSEAQLEDARQIEVVPTPPAEPY